MKTTTLRASLSGVAPRPLAAIGCAVLAATSACGVAAAQTSEPPRVIEHVLVTMPLHKESAETALPFTVLSGDALRRAAVATLGDTLRDVPGVANASFGPGVGQPVIRGQTGPRVRVLQNGTTSADASKASQDHANAVEPLLACMIAGFMVTNFSRFRDERV